MYGEPAMCPGTVLHRAVPGAEVLYCTLLYLPGAKGDPAITDWQGQVRAQQAGLGGHMLLSWGILHGTVLHQTIETCLD